MAHDFDLVIVGMGSGGMVAAEFAATLGARCAIVERERVGGDCLWTGCVPSKALLASAKVAHHMRSAAAYGIEPCEPVIDTARVFERVRAVQARIAATDDNPDRFRDLGLEVIVDGPARVVGPHTVETASRTLDAKFILITTGSRPFEPPVPGLAEAGYVTSESVWDLERAPASMVFLGGGPIAVELSQAFALLGVAVTVLQREPRILVRDEPELVDALVPLLRADGVDLRLGAAAESVSVSNGSKVVHGAGGESWAAEQIFVGAGRSPNVEGLGLEELGVEVGPRGIVVDDALRTSVSSVY